MSTPEIPPETPAPEDRKSVFIKTWGCQMNVYDSQRMADVLKPLGYDAVDSAEQADMVILNTCHIREKATEKLYSDLGRMRETKSLRLEAGKQSLIAVAGCVAQAEGSEIARRAPTVDMVFGPQTYHLLPEMVIAANGGKRVINTDFPVESKFDFLPVEAGHDGASAFVSVQEGCDKFCSFCVVPYTRGAESSRAPEQILAEIKSLLSRGVREITLLGQNVNAWHGTDAHGKVWGLGRLIRAMAELDKLARIRYMTSHPRDMDTDLIAAHGDVPQLMPFLHLPVQSGSNAILKAMNRKHDRDLYFRIIDDLRAARPDIALSSDFIVGFPGESDADFADTIDLVERVGFAQAYSFKYSKRPGTPAAVMQNQISDKIMTARLAQLQDLLFSQARSFNTGFIGQTIPVLCDRKGRTEGQIHGRTAYNQPIHLTAPDRLLGQIIDVTILNATATSLEGKVAIAEPITGENAA